MPNPFAAGLPAFPEPSSHHGYGGRLAARPELHIPLAEGSAFYVDGVAAISRIHLPLGAPVLLVFTASGAILVNGSRLLVPGGNITVAAGDSAWVWPIRDDIVRVVNYSRADGTPLAGGAVLAPSVRLTLTSGVPITTEDVAGATAIYVMPMGSAVTPIYNGSIDVARTVPASTTLTLNATPHLANTNYDVFEAWVGGAYVVGTGPAWSVSTGGSGARGTGAGTTELAYRNGRRVNAVSITLTNGGTTYSVAANQANLIGGFRCTSVAGQTEDSVTKRLVWNEFNAVPRKLRAVDTADYWTVAAGTQVWRQANANTGNRVCVCNGASGKPVAIEVNASANNNTDNTLILAAVGIGVNSVTVDSARDNGTIVPTIVDGSLFNTTYARYRGYPALGYNEFNWLEINDTSKVVRYGGRLGRTFVQQGMLGETIQ